MMKSRKGWAPRVTRIGAGLLAAAAAAVVCPDARAADSDATPHAAIVRDVTAWLDGMKGKTYAATFRAADGVSPLPATAVNNRQFAFRRGDEVYIGIGFSEPPTAGSTLEALRKTLKYVALDRIPVPGVPSHAWETRLQTPVSSFKDGVTLESWKDGVLRVRVKTEFFAAYGRRTDILVPADAGMPEGTYFQIRRPLKADLLIEGRLFPAP